MDVYYDLSPGGAYEVVGIHSECTLKHDGGVLIDRAVGTYQDTRRWRCSRTGEPPFFLFLLGDGRGRGEKRDGSNYSGFSRIAKSWGGNIQMLNIRS